MDCGAISVPAWIPKEYAAAWLQTVSKDTSYMQKVAEDAAKGQAQTGAAAASAGGAPSSDATARPSTATSQTPVTDTVALSDKAKVALQEQQAASTPPRDTSVSTVPDGSFASAGGAPSSDATARPSTATSQTPVTDTVTLSDKAKAALQEQQAASTPPRDTSASTVPDGSFSAYMRKVAEDSSKQADANTTTRSPEERAYQTYDHWLDLPDDEFQNRMKTWERGVRSQYGIQPDTSNNPTYKLFATINVHGHMVEIDNNGAVSTHDVSIGLHLGRQTGPTSDNIALDEGLDQNLRGPELALGRILNILKMYKGSELVLADTAMTQKEWQAVPPVVIQYDEASLANDPDYLVLKALKAARAEWEAQRDKAQVDAEHTGSKDAPDGGAPAAAV